MEDENLIATVIIATLVFLMAPASIVLYIQIYNRRKRSLAVEKEEMRLSYEAELAHTQLAISEQTMQTIGADLHDNIGQIMSLVALTLGAVENSPDHNQQIKINSARELVGRSIEELRLLGKLIEGGRLLEGGLVSAVRQEISWIEKSGRFQKASLTIESCDRESSLDTQKALIIFRVIQELINNVIKHAEADDLSVSIIFNDYGLQIEVSDNGKGFSHGPHALQQGMGMYTIRKRVSILKGQLKIISENTGSQIQVFIPL